MSSIPVVLRVKKRKCPTGSSGGVSATVYEDATSSDAAAAAVRLLLAPAPEKRPRVGESEGEIRQGGSAPPPPQNAFTSGLFVFAGRVTSSEAALAEAAVRRAISKRKLDGETERLRRRLGERPSEGEGRLFYRRRRRVEPTPLTPLAASSTADAAAQASTVSTSATASTACRFRIVDFEAANSKPRVSRDQIACNGVAMTSTASVPETVSNDNCHEDGVYYDVYYGYGDADIGNNNNGSDGIFSDTFGSRQERQQLQYLLQTYEEAYRYGADEADSGGCAFDIDDGADDDSDSNSESNWRNEYPDTPEGSEDEGGKSESDDDVEDVDPYDDADGDIGGLARQLGVACLVAFDEKDEDADSDGDCDVADADQRDWLDFKRQLLQRNSSQQQQSSQGFPSLGDSHT